jgi:hypothetical protein
MDDPLLMLCGVSGLFDFEAEKKRLIENLDWFKSMSVEAFTFYKKWEELQETDICESGVVKAQIWTPLDLQDEKYTVKEIQELKPRVVGVNTPELDKTWHTLRKYSHSAEHHNTPGRFMKFLLVDDVSGKILGFTSIASEMPALKGRDEVIGVKRDVWMAKDGKGTNNHSVQCPCIASTQPLGYNFLGGKLMATMLTTSTVRDAYFQQYHDVLVGMTTTSLYGAESMYNGIKWWKGVGISAGKIYLQPSPDIYDRWHEWLKKNKKDVYLEKMTQKEGISGPVTSAKMRVINMIFKETGIKSSTYHHGYQRGCYYSCFYENGFSFLRGEIDESQLVMKPLFKNDVQAVLDWWKPKAINRYKKLKAEGRLNGEKLFYNNVKGMTYEEAKKTFSGAVGR